MNKIILSGFLAVYGALIGNNRDINKVIIESARYNKVMESKLRIPEQRQYSKILNICKKRNIKVEFSKSPIFDELKTSGGIAAEVFERRFTPAEELLNIQNPFLAFVEGIEDPYNFGYVLRSLHLSGVDAVLLPERNFFSSSDIVAKSSAGLSETMTLVICKEPEAFCNQLKANGVKIVCTAVENSVSMYQCNLKKPLLLVIGGEKRGISKTILNFADSTICINYAKDTNIALSAVSAASVLAFEVYRQNNINLL